jgi:hypothetical protein
MAVIYHTPTLVTDYNIFFSKLLFVTTLIFATTALEFRPNFHYRYVYEYVRLSLCVFVCRARVHMFKAFPLQAWKGPWGSWRLRLQNF